MRCPTLTLIVAALGFATAAQAQDGLVSTFNTVDANGDGEITKAEFLAYHSERFQEILENFDADKNQTLAKTELTGTSPEKSISLRPPLFKSDEPKAVKLRRRAPAGAGPLSPTSRRYKLER